MKSRLKKQRISSLGLISFTDVIFLLIIFLLISSNFVTHAGIKVDLPGAATHQNEFTKNISITYTKDDKIFVGEQQVDWNNLAEVLSARLIEDPQQVVVIRADQEIALKKIVKIIDLAKLSGTERFFIATQIQKQENEY
ncbi:MAG: biopolymer transport protein ExbD [Candidatus Cloacimonadota bacterium]|jgi:biopolymer transport protein ExbD|nr:biopolymer transport protein ExbD [Candidatus Cloacimonadota bacterium]